MFQHEQFRRECGADAFLDQHLSSAPRIYFLFVYNGWVKVTEVTPLGTKTAKNGSKTGLYPNFM